jgi:prepilin-type processing-associated H-X9-DG protein
MSIAPPPRMSRLALASLILGVLSLGLSLVGSVPALLLGLYGLRAINGDPDRYYGRRAAVTGMVLGGVFSLLTVVGFIALVIVEVNLRSQRVGCTDNLRQLGLAINIYHDSHGNHYPAAVVRADKLPPERRLSWGVEILPSLELQTPAAKQWQTVSGKLDPSQPWDAPVNAPGLGLRSPRWLCPAWRPPESKPPQGWTTYVGLAGVGRDAPGLDPGDPRVGFFGYERRPSRTDVRAGISNTMMVTETTRQLGPWVAGGHPTLRSLEPGAETYIGSEESFGGLHAEGANVLYVDGSVRLVPATVDPGVFRRQATLSGSPVE